MDEKGLDGKDALDLDGSRLVDDKGRGMIKVCEDEDAADPEADQELQELRDVFRRKIKDESPDSDVELASVAPISTKPCTSGPRSPPESDETQALAISSRSIAPNQAPQGTRSRASPQGRPAPKTGQQRASKSNEESKRNTDGKDISPACPVCSFENPGPTAPITCSMCANVLDPTVLPGVCWKCHNPVCGGGLYWNSADCGICGLCGTKRP